MHGQATRSEAAALAVATAAAVRHEDRANTLNYELGRQCLHVARTPGAAEYSKFSGMAACVFSPLPSQIGVGFGAG